MQVLLEADEEAPIEDLWTWTNHRQLVRKGGSQALSFNSKDKAQDCSKDLPRGKSRKKRQVGDPFYFIFNLLAGLFTSLLVPIPLISGIAVFKNPEHLINIFQSLYSQAKGEIRRLNFAFFQRVPFLLF